jgi:pSer/pThr/pTyr-binding forkhead associated (FHA) protein
VDSEEKFPYQLVCQSGPLQGTTLDVAEEIRFGRDSSCDVVLDDPKVSRHHGTLRRMGTVLVYTDNKSTNGSFVNGERVIEKVIRLGDTLKLGTSEFALLEHNDFRSINFVAGETMITGFVETKSVRPDALADKLAAVLEYYKQHQPELSPAEQHELLRTQRLLVGMKTIYAMSQKLGKLVPMAELLTMVGDSLFNLFPGAENLVILLRDEEKARMVPRHAAARDGHATPSLAISRTVLDKAVAQRATLIANDAAGDFATSESIIGFKVKSVMCAPLVVGNNCLGALYLDSRRQNVNYDELDAELVTAFANQCAIAIENSNLMDAIQSHYHQTLQSLVAAIEAKDAYTMGHTQRVAKYSVGISRALGLAEAHIERIKMAADLHDIGKIGVREGIINKAGKLTETEYSSIKHHVEMGEKILQPILHLRDLLPAIRGHHEKWDGTGYPDGLKGEECPLEARIIALADAFDAMTSQRTYNKPLTFAEGLARVKEASGRHFDPRIVEAFEKYLRTERLVPVEPPSPGGTTAPPTMPASAVRAT